MARALSALIFLVTMVLVNSAEQCPEGQVWNDCASPCTKYCVFRAYTDSPECATDGTGVCDTGCACKPGYLFNNKLECVKNEDCEGGPHACKEDQEWNECASLCKKYCVFREFADRPECALDGTGVCDTGCACKPGYLFNQKLECVKEEQCEPTT